VAADKKLHGGAPLQLQRLGRRGACRGGQVFAGRFAATPCIGERVAQTGARRRSSAT